MFFKNLWDKILSLFGRSTSTTNKEYTDNQNYATNYQDINGINFNAIFSNKLSNYAANDSEVAVLGENARAKYLNDKMKDLWSDRKKIFNRMLGMGGVFVLPYYAKGEIQYNLIPQFRVSINEKIGKRIVNMTVLADVYTQKKGYTTKIFYRWSDYKVNNNNLVIEQRYTDENGSPVGKPEIWEDIQDYFLIPNTNKVLGGYFKSPRDNRQAVDNYGVPITYGCEKTIKEIKETLAQLKREYELKQAFVGADSTMFNGKDALPLNGLFKKIDSGDDTFFEVFDPQFRSYLDRLEELFRRLEHEVGTSAGIISQVQTQNATATEIKRSTYDTFTIVTDSRDNFEAAMADLIESINVLANYYNITPMGDYDISYEWSNKLVEDEEATYNRLLIASDKGIIKKAEVREYLHPEETLEESQKVIDEIKEENPSVKDLLGIKEGEE